MINYFTNTDREKEKTPPISAIPLSQSIMHGFSVFVQVMEDRRNPISCFDSEVFSNFLVQQHFCYCN